MFIFSWKIKFVYSEQNSKIISEWIKSFTKFNTTIVLKNMVVYHIVNNIKIVYDNSVVKGKYVLHL